MAKDNVREVERDETIPPLPDAENDDLAASMIDGADENDTAVENRLETEDGKFKDEMEGQADEEIDAEGEEVTE